MLESSLRVCLLAGAVGGILLLARVRSGSVRHAAWSAVLGAMLLMPVLPYWVPAVVVPLPAPARSIEMIPGVLEIPPPLPEQQISDTSARTPVLAGAPASPPQPAPATPAIHGSIWPVVALTP
jgi:hypothetical protein